MIFSTLGRVVRKDHRVVIITIRHATAGTTGMHTMMGLVAEAIAAVAVVLVHEVGGTIHIVEVVAVEAVGVTQAIQTIGL
jgi:hypothetical protein